MTAPTPEPTTASAGERERLIEAILATRWPNGDRFNGVNEWTAGMIADSILANHAAPTVDGAAVDEAAVWVADDDGHTLGVGATRSDAEALADARVADYPKADLHADGWIEPGLPEYQNGEWFVRYYDGLSFRNRKQTIRRYPLAVTVPTSPVTVTDEMVERAKDAMFDILYDLGGSDSTKADEALARAALAAALTEGGAE